MQYLILLLGTDKVFGGARKKTDFNDYAPYITAFLTALPDGIGKVFVATDDNRLLYTVSDFINNTQTLYFFNDTWRNDNDHSTFGDFKDKREVLNGQVLNDILMLSSCDYLIHGHSAVSESAIYLNFKLHYRSVNIEHDAEHRKMSSDLFHLQSVEKADWYYKRERHCIC